MHSKCCSSLWLLFWFRYSEAQVSAYKSKARKPLLTTETGDWCDYGSYGPAGT